MFFLLLLSKNVTASSEEEKSACNRVFDMVTLINQQVVNDSGTVRPYLSEWSSSAVMLEKGQQCCANSPEYINSANQKITMGDIIVYGDGSSGMYGKVLDALRNNDGEVVLVVLFVDRSKKLLVTSVKGESDPDIYLANDRKDYFEDLISDLVEQPLFSKQLMSSAFSLLRNAKQAPIKRDSSSFEVNVGDWITYSEYNQHGDGKTILRLAKVKTIFFSGVESYDIVVDQLRSDGRVVSVLLSKSNVSSLKRMDPQPSQNLRDELVFRSFSKNELIIGGGILAAPGAPVLVPTEVMEGGIDPNFVVLTPTKEPAILGTIESLDVLQAWNSGEFEIKMSDRDAEFNSVFSNGRISLSDGSSINLFEVRVLERIEGLNPLTEMKEDGTTVLSSFAEDRSNRNLPKGKIRMVPFTLKEPLTHLTSDLFVSFHISAVPLARHKSGEGNFERWINLQPNLMDDLGFVNKLKGAIIYPEIAGLNYRLENHPRFKQTYQHISLKPKLKYIRDVNEYLENWNYSLAQNKFLISSDGPEHFMEMGVIPALVLLPPVYIENMTKAARLLESLKNSFPEKEKRAAIRKSMGLLRGRFFQALEMVEDIVFFESVSRVKILEDFLRIDSIFMNEELQKAFQRVHSEKSSSGVIPLTSKDIEKKDLLEIFAIITGVSAKEAEHKLGLETARSFQKLKFNLKYNNDSLVQLLRHKSYR